MTANVKYKLSQAGQKAALIAGKPATSVVAETMEFSDAALIDKLRITPTGEMDYDRSFYGWPDLDAPPADLASLIAAMDAHTAAETERKRVAEEAARIKADADFPVVEALLAEYEALPLGEKANTTANTIGARYSHPYAVTPEQQVRFQAQYAARKIDAERIKREAEEAKESARLAMIAEHGGIVFTVEAGMCSFTGAGLWSSGQSKRWVGIFTAPKGIDSFCDSPRGEHTFSVTGLTHGDCIQGGGYDTNSRGKRRSETEWFGVVVRRDDNEIVVDLHDSRAATMGAAKKLK